jgi:hypothetical protein
VRGSLFWNGITWAQDPSRGRSDFHLGPLLSVEQRPGAERISVGNGLIGARRRSDGTGWHFFAFEFSGKGG